MYFEQMARKPKRARTVRREAQRDALAFARDRERLFALDRGGSPEQPIDISATSVVEVRASATACPRCGGRHRLEEHAAVTTASGARLREARLVCSACGSRRSLWFRLLEPN
jgi:DNA-directed RNA polymerase subunit RPC12/RpoP